MEFNSPEMRSIDRQIENVVGNLRNSNNIREIAEYRSEVNRYIAARITSVVEMSGSDGGIRDLASRREAYENEINRDARYVTAVRSGIVSYRVDGLEEVLTPGKMQELNASVLRNLDLSAGRRIPSSENKGKIVDNFETFIAVTLTTEEARNASVGRRITLRVSGGELIPAVIHSAVPSENGSVFIIFRTTESAEQLIEYRKINMDVIWWEYEGLKIPNSVLMHNNGLAYVVRNRAGNIDKLLVKILRETANYSIVYNYSMEELIDRGFEIDEIRGMGRVNVFDELMVRPNISEFF